MGYRRESVDFRLSIYIIGSPMEVNTVKVSVGGGGGGGEDSISARIRQGKQRIRDRDGRRQTVSRRYGGVGTAVAPANMLIRALCTLHSVYLSYTTLQYSNCEEFLHALYCSARL